jgi:hypothetical protein
VELVEGAEESILPKVAAAMATGVSRRSQAAAAAIRVTREIVGRERSAIGAGSGDRPRPEPGRLSRARVGRLGQLANWAKQALVICFKNKFQKSNLNIISFLNLIQTQNSNNINKTFSYSLMK